MRRSSVHFAAAGALLLAAASTPCPTQTTPDSNPLVSVSVRDVSVAEALGAVFERAHLRFELTKDAARAAASRKVTASLADTPLVTAVGMILRTGAGDGVTFVVREDRGVYRIGVKGAAGLRDAGPPASPSLDSVRVSLKATNLTYREVLDRLAHAARTLIRVHPDLRPALDRPAGPVELDAVELRTAFAQILRAAIPQGPPPLVIFDVSDLQYKVTPASPASPAPDAPSRAVVGADVKDTPAPVALRNLLDRAGADYAFDPTELPAGRMTAHLQPNRVGSVVEELVRQVTPDAFVIREHGGILSIARADRAVAARERPTRITARFRDANVRYALKALFEVSDRNYVLDPLVYGTVTAEIADLPFDEAVKLVLRRARTPVPVVYGANNGTYSFVPDPNYNGWN